ncbi:hypothetical protein OCU04_009065 [Sclerotinia nivalis]|uniref:Uncharacterized protein n=1 Tax=Sclerotinia nivalis TaxID=352851 RepID=A0A9X0DI56_9HELO|nr:hypothetical protein OCU04_009065 [Sclerotinia nivalis]
MASEHLTSLVPGMVKQCTQYCETLRELAKKSEMFQLDPVTLRLMLDLIGKTILNADLGAQKGYNVLADSMLSQIRWHKPTAEFNPLEYVNFVRWYM